MILLTIDREENHFVVDDKSVPGSPPVGRGDTMMEAIGNYFHHNRDRFDLDFIVTKEALPYEMERRKQELGKR
jgi:hypothetical protein